MQWQFDVSMSGSTKYISIYDLEDNTRGYIKCTNEKEYEEWLTILQKANLIPLIKIPQIPTL